MSDTERSRSRESSEESSDAAAAGATANPEDTPAAEEQEEGPRKQHGDRLDELVPRDGHREPARGEEQDRR